MPWPALVMGVALMFFSLAALAETPPPSTLDATTHDLILLNSGEWLQGDIDRIRDGTVYFDSLELEDLEIDLDDIKEIIADRPSTFRFEGRRDILTGPVRMDSEEFAIGDQIRPRSALIGMIAGVPKELNYWNGMVSVGYTLSSGNTNQSALSVLAKLNRETALTRLKNTYNGAFSTGNNDIGANTTTANNHRLNSAFDYYLTSRFFVIVPALEVFADKFQNIDMRLTPNAGLGYDFLRRSKITWSAIAAMGYQYTKLSTVQPPTPKTENDAAVIVGMVVETDPTKRIEWDTDYTVQVIATNIGRTNHHLTSLASVELIGALDLDVTFNWDRIEQPATIDDGVNPPTTPKKNDYRISVGLGFDF